jgi:two-component system, chemotaxis family, sensor histidine kinase and response regulator PixL
LPTVLLAEDDDDLRGVIATTLMEHGFDVVATKDGEDAFERLVGGPAIDVLLLDLQMPRLGGRELYERLRSYVRFRDLPVVVLTAFDHLRIPADVTHVLKKPISIDALVGNLRLYARA